MQMWCKNDKKNALKKYIKALKYQDKCTYFN